MTDLINQMRRECDACYTPQGQTVRACSYHEGWLDGYGEREAEVERLRAALDTEEEAGAFGWHVIKAKTAEIERLRQDIERLRQDRDEYAAKAALTEGGES